jgi:hypothetical protein
MYNVAAAEVKAREPLGWSYADLNEVKVFLQQAIKDGLYHPVFMEGLH